MISRDLKNVFFLIEGMERSQFSLSHHVVIMLISEVSIEKIMTFSNLFAQFTIFFKIGITPGSMPPHSTSLAQEGAAFKSFLLVENGQFKEDEITKALTTATDAKGATGTRNLADNLSDLKAQVAANQKGIQLVSELIDSYGLRIVQAYMNYIQQNAEVAVRDMLKEIARKTRER